MAGVGPSRAGEIKLLGAASLAISHRGNDLWPGWGGGGGGLTACRKKGMTQHLQKNGAHANK